MDSHLQIFPGPDQRERKKYSGSEEISAAHHDLCSGDTGDRVAKTQSAELSPPEPPPADTLGGPTPPEAGSEPWKELPSTEHVVVLQVL